MCRQWRWLGFDIDWPMKCLCCSSVDGDGDLLETFGKTFFYSESTLTMTVLLVNDSFRGVSSVVRCNMVKGACA